MLTSTKDVKNQYLKVLVYGASGSGKTRLAATVKNPLIISAEAGLLSLREYDLPVWRVTSMADVRGAYQEAKNGDYEWIVIDSISELSEIDLAEIKPTKTDARQAYGEMADNMLGMIRAFRDLDKHIYMTAKQDKNKDEISGAMLYGPKAEGKVLTQGLPYLFDEVYALHVLKGEDGVVNRALQTDRDNQYDAKDRSGALDFWEPADLGQIQSKILDI